MLARRMTPKLDEQLIGLLAALAKLCRTEVETETFLLYVEHLEPLGLDRACAAVKQIMLERDGNDPFPSAKAIRAVMDPKADPDAEALHVASEILSAVRTCGSHNWERARDRLGTLAWAVVGKYTGYVALCAALNERNETTYRAQFRDLARSYLKHGVPVTSSSPALADQRRGPEPKMLGFGEVMKKALEGPKGDG